MGFAKFVLGEDDENDSPVDGQLPGDARQSDTDEQTFPWISTRWPSPSVLQVAVDAYFDRVNWYILLFHQPSFTVRAQNIVQPSAWRRDGLCEVLLVAAVAAFGLRCVQHDKTWKGHRVLEAHSVTAGSVVADLMSQIGTHFYEIMLESRIEAYQICMLLTTYHVYFGSSNFAWNVSGVSSRTAYALALHCDKARNTDEIAREVGNRCWNHLVVADQFSTMILGRPASLDPAFAQFRMLTELDDTELPSSTAALPILQEDERPVSFLTYHTLKFEIYHIIRQTLQSFKVLQLPSPASVQDLKAFIQVVNTTEDRLKQWHENLPAVFKPSQWSAEDPWNVLELERCTPEERSVRRKLGLQGFILQLLHDAARVWAHRPLLKLRISLSPNQDKIPLDDLPDSLGTSVRAALRMSGIPVNEFEGHVAQSFVLMHLFTAGIILCIAPTCQPYSQVAGEAKAGVLRIIAACRAIKDDSKIAKHTDQMLTRLYKRTMEREMENALRVSDTGRPKDRIGQTVAGRQFQDNHAAPQSHRRGYTTPQATSQVDMEAATAATVQSETPSGLDYQNGNRADEWPDESVVSYLQFESLHHADRTDFHVDEHIDEAYGAFEESECNPVFRS
ncbi:hypothetical protein EDD36DRAFT_141415 [Exophiala viscosa]|uniref:Xylanolytic transcriptional activator regulatory domain-containing protein n=1 Tax=Exophiala viscosa TaxID=2486360 RepID=A0AAN6E1W2_9EURO|nr:hypothetical protein EDD36DRAFT_141415 [Exophiala viscosa]